MRPDSASSSSSGGGTDQELLHRLHSAEDPRGALAMGLPVAGKLAVLWVVKKVFVLGAIKAYGPGKLYRRTRSWNRYLLRGLPGVRRGGDATLSFLFRLPDRLLGKHGTATATASAAGPLMRAASGPSVARAQKSVQDRWLAKSASSSGGYAASPLMQRARAARQRVASKLPTASAALQAGKHKAGTLMSRGVLASRQVAGSLAPKDFMMGHVRHIRSEFGQSLPVSTA